MLYFLRKTATLSKSLAKLMMPEMVKERGSPTFSIHYLLSSLSNKQEQIWKNAKVKNRNHLNGREPVTSSQYCPLAVLSLKVSSHRGEPRDLCETAIT